MWLKLKKIIYSVNKGLLFLSFKNNIWPSVEHLSVVEKLDYNLVIDIGANKGQFALLLLE